MSTAHTPGPWGFNQCVGNDGYMFIHCGTGRVSSNLKGYCSSADARLIAAAPDLLKALQYLRGCIECGKEPAMSTVNAAIAKATGEAA